MFKLRIAALAVLSCTAICAQVSQNTVTVTASRNTSSAPDQAVFNVAVTAGVDQELSDVIAALDCGCDCQRSTESRSRGASARQDYRHCRLNFKRSWGLWDYCDV
ncbi:MAG: hypothetical protein JO307_15280, partial [Bryobacterales bacterium]|nr:hypothetical protein [Bryobacterales bacterium]